MIRLFKGIAVGAVRGAGHAAAGPRRGASHRAGVRARRSAIPRDWVPRPRGVYRTRNSMWTRPRGRKTCAGGAARRGASEVLSPSGSTRRAPDPGAVLRLFAFGPWLARQAL